MGFRWFTRESATRLRLRGIVRNAADGSVQVVAEGSARALEQLEARLREGPGAAMVDRVEEIAPPETELPRDFRIVR